MSQSAIVIFDIDGVIRDVSHSYRRALADTVEYGTNGAYRPSQVDIDDLKSEGLWNNDWEASQEFVYRYFEARPLLDRASLADQTNGIVAADPQARGGVSIAYDKLVAFFQSRYRGTDPINWNGYICQEPLLLEPDYLALLTEAGIQWGFFSGATQGSARYVLEKRLGLQTPVLIAMEDAPGKPDPTGLLATVQMLEKSATVKQPVLYVGDTVADMYTIKNAREQDSQRQWIAIGVLPPHVQVPEERSLEYTNTMKQAGADIVFWNVQELTPEKIWQLVRLQ